MKYLGKKEIISAVLWATFIGAMGYGSLYILAKVVS